MSGRPNSCYESFNDHSSPEYQPVLPFYSNFYLTMNRNDPSHAWHGSFLFRTALQVKEAALMTTTTQLVLSNFKRWGSLLYRRGLLLAEQLTNVFFLSYFSFSAGTRNTPSARGSDGLIVYSLLSLAFASVVLRRTKGWDLGAATDFESFTFLIFLFSYIFFLVILSRSKRKPLLRCIGMRNMVMSLQWIRVVITYCQRTTFNMAHEHWLIGRFPLCCSWSEFAFSSPFCFFFHTLFHARFAVGSVRYFF